MTVFRGRRERRQLAQQGDPGQRHTRRRRRDGRGAAAVELALVSLILFPVLFGIVDYGLWFNDSLTTRNGVREGARLAVVQNLNGPTGCSAQQGAARMACVTQRLVDPAAGTSYARVVAPAGWKRGNPVVVCAMTKVTGVTGVTPLPEDGLVRAKVQMSVEVDSPVVDGGNPTTATTGTPSGATWDWCS